MRTFTDRYGDRVEINYDGTTLAVEVTEDDEPCEAVLSAQQAEELADAIYEELGANATPKGLVKASDISYNEGALRLASVHDKEVRFRYAKGDGSTIETRQFKPERVAKNQAGEVYFQGYDPDRDDTRNYRVDRILGDVEVLA